MSARNYLFVLFCLLFFKNFAFAQVTVSAELDSTQMLIGDQMKLHLLVNHAAGVTVEKPDFSVLEKSKLELLNVTEWDTLKKGVETVLQKDVTFTAWDSGYVWIPKIPVPYQQNGQTAVTSTEEVPISVLTPALDTTLAPIKPIIKEPVKFEDFIPYLAGLIFLVVLSLGIYYFFIRKKRQLAPPPPEIKLPAHEIALDKLEALDKAKLWQQGKIKQYQSELTFILREYLENRFGIQALESTTDEILAQIKNVEAEAVLKTQLKELLQLADLVKFAKAKPAVEVHDRMMKYVEEFVRSTKKIEVLTEEVQEENV